MPLFPRKTASHEDWLAMMNDSVQPLEPVKSLPRRHNIHIDGTRSAPTTPPLPMIEEEQEPFETLLGCIPNMTTRSRAASDLSAASVDSIYSEESAPEEQIYQEETTMTMDTIMQDLELHLKFLEETTPSAPSTPSLSSASTLSEDERDLLDEDENEDFVDDRWSVLSASVAIMPTFYTQSKLGHARKRSVDLRVRPHNSNRSYRVTSAQAITGMPIFTKVGQVGMLDVRRL